MGWHDTFFTDSAESKKKKGWHSFFFDAPPTHLERTDISNQRQLEELQLQQRTGDFRDYQAGKTLAGKAWKGITKPVGIAFDVLNRGAAAMGGAMEERMKRDERWPFIESETYKAMGKRAVQELFSPEFSMRKKKYVPDVLKEYRPGYKKFTEEHPIASILVDLGADILSDPTTLIPGAVFAKGGKGIGKGIAKGWKGAKKVIPQLEKVAGIAGRAFDPAYLWKKAGASKGYDILWSEGKFSNALRKKLQKGIEPYVETVATWEPEKIKNFIKVMYGDADAIPMSDDVADVVSALQGQLKGIGRRESKYLGKGTDWMIENYFPNNPKQFTELMENVGDYLPSGHGRGLADWKQVFERQKVLRTGDDFLDWLKTVGVSDENLGEVVTMNLMGRAGASARRIKQIRINHKLIRDLPDVFEQVPFGTRKVWSLTKEGAQIVRPGNTLWQPAGNLRFFKQTLRDVIPVKILDALEDTGGKITPEIMDKIDNAIDAATRTVIHTTSEGGAKTTGPLKKLEEVVKGSLKARGMTEGETVTYIGKLKASGGDLVTTIENKTTVNKDEISRYIKTLLGTLPENQNITPELINKLNRTIIGVTTRVKAYQVPIDIVEDIDKVSVNLANQSKLWRHWDGMLNVFKNTAILSPFFHIRNFVSSASQNYLADINFARYADAIDVFKQNLAGNKNKIILGKTAGGWYNLFKTHGIRGGSFIGQQTGKTGIPIAEDVFRFNRWVGSHVEDVSRAPLFMDRIVKGDTPLEAAKAVKKYHFDYSELTDFERNIMKRAMPFYSWTRHNIPLQIDKLFTAPKKYRNIAKFKRAVAGGPDTQYEPDWWKEQDVWQTKFQDKEENRMAIMVGLPYSDLNSMFTNPTGSLGPAGAIASLGMNYDPFYRKEIREFPGQKEALLTIGRKQVGRVDPRVKYAMEHIVPVIKRYGTDLSKEASQILMGEANTETKLKFLNRFVGVRLIPLTKDKQEKSRIYGLMNDLNNYKKYRTQEESVR